MQAKALVRTAGANFLAVGAASAEIKSDMLPGKLYMFTCSQACWVKQGEAGSTTASAGANSVLCLPVQTYFFHGSNGPALAVIQDAVAGKASINLMDEI